jgi:hypothetical protein
LPVSDGAKAIVLREIRKKIPGQNFVAVSPQHAQQLQEERRIYRGDFGVRFEVMANFFGQVVTEKGSMTRPDGVRVTTWQLNVPRLQRIK